LVYQRKQAKLQWLQDPREVNEDNLRNVTWEASRCSRYKKREYVKNKIIELTTNSKHKNNRYLYRAITEFKKGYQPKTNLVKDESGGKYCILRYRKLLRWSGTKKNCLTVERVNCRTYSQKRVIKLSVVIIEANHYCQLHTKFYPTFFSLG
jgi:hypothetical protein